MTKNSRRKIVPVLVLLGLIGASYLHLTVLDGQNRYRSIQVSSK